MRVSSLSTSPTEIRLLKSPREAAGQRGASVVSDPKCVRNRESLSGQWVLGQMALYGPGRGQPELVGVFDTIGKLPPSNCSRHSQVVGLGGGSSGGPCGSERRPGRRAILLPVLNAGMDPNPILPYEARVSPRREQPHPACTVDTVQGYLLPARHLGV